jgi:membrane protein DedA with SNARE-associated domain
MLALLIWFLSDFFASWSGGNFTQGKKSGELGIISLLVIVIAVIFNLIWGGIFWW